MFDYQYGAHYPAPVTVPGISYTDPLTLRVEKLERTVAKLAKDVYSDQQDENQVETTVTTTTANTLFTLGKDQEILKLKQEIERQRGQISALSAELDDAVEEQDRLNAILEEIQSIVLD